jgi:hypothetical protein
VVEEHRTQADSSPEEPAQPSPAAPIPVQALPRQAVGEAGAVSAETPQLTAAQRRRQVSRANRYARYQQIVALSREGLSQRAIARQLHLSRGCVHRYVTATSFPERALPGKRRSQLDPYLPYLRQRWEQGCHNGRQLTHEIEVQGFRGSASLVRQLIGGWRASLPARQPGVRGPKRRTPAPAQRRVSARQASWWFVTPPGQLTDNQRVLLERVCQTNATLQELYQLGQQFALMAEAASSTTARPLAPASWPELFDGPARLCFRHRARLRRRQNGLVRSLESRPGGRSDHALEISEKADVRAGSLRAAALARPPQSLIQAPHKLRMSLKSVPLDTHTHCILKQTLSFAIKKNSAASRHRVPRL